MASKFDSTQLSLLKQFVELCKTKPELLYSPQLKFFKDWVERYRNLYALYYCNILSDNRHVQLYNAQVTILNRDPKLLIATEIY